jgi:K+-sensing histidine kinase KdpD
MVRIGELFIFEKGTFQVIKCIPGKYNFTHECNCLGLALVRKVIDIIGAKISVTSKAGEGTIFAVRLKMAEKA